MVVGEDRRLEVRLPGQVPASRAEVAPGGERCVLDVLRISDPVALEDTINGIAGVVSVGLFARRPADVLILGTESGTRVLPQQ